MLYFFRYCKDVLLDVKGVLTKQNSYFYILCQNLIVVIKFLDLVVCLLCMYSYL